MKASRSFGKPLWVASITAAVLLYGSVIIPEQRALARVELQAQTLYEAADSDERIVSQEAKIARARAAITTQIESAIAGPTAAAAMLDALDADSRRFDVKVVALHPRVAASPQSVKPLDPLTQSGLTIDLEGSYASILRFIAEISETYPLLSVDGVALESAGAQDNSLKLHATVDASAYELSVNWKEIINDRAFASR